MSAHRHFLQKLRQISDASFVRFLLVGGSFALVNATLAALLTAALPLPAAICAVLAWVVCLTPAWYCQRRFAFHRANARRGGGWFYALAQAISVGISAGAGALFARGEPGYDFFIYLAASAVAAVSSYLIARLVIFSDQHGKT